MSSVKAKLKILFLCTGNSCRSQMAEGWAKYLKAKELDAYSAGVAPQGMNPLAVKVMAEAGVDITKQYSKHIDELNGVAFDYILAVCDKAANECPISPAEVKRINHCFADPPQLALHAKTEEEALVFYRRVRDEIRGFIEGLPETLANLVR